MIVEIFFSTPDRPLYTEGVIEKLMTLMIRNTKGDQYKECLTKIVTSKIIIVEPVMYENTLKEVYIIYYAF